MKRSNFPSWRGTLHNFERNDGVPGRNARFSRLLRGLMVFFIPVVLLMGFGNVFAKEEPKPIPYGDWALRCPVDKNPCSLNQRILVEIKETKTPIVFFSFIYAGKPISLHAVLRLPLGIALAHGVNLQVDEGSPLTWDVSHCDREGCLTMGKISPELRKTLQAGKKVYVIFHTLDGKAVTIPASLKGITAGLKALDKKKKK
uniref:Invasion protein IalB, involved in pathogenesis n=1 Tax=Candidatus Kentrum sp. LFY TaxID=2126342 RepID=A0A450U824_9GAMM|nr:MAG: Invasion protein IalB, involved in pathogenesis [Candidatus Kentron sp. LFY]